jgi:2'-5' RNA ligase
MYGIVSLLDDPTDQLVRDLWSEIREKTGIRTIAEFLPHPHITYHGAEKYDRDRVRALMDELATEIAPFTVRITGLGIFTHPQQVLYLPVARSPDLAELHAQLWEEAHTAAEEPSPLYGSHMWMPHITLAQHDIDPDSLATLMGILSDRDLTREITIDNMALFAGAGEDESGELYRVTLTGEEANDTAK